ncbi:hypothetical protein [Streptomyces sp. NPDC053079]|uniref:hypothetical protein n=1 Tax=Streptomyces sp. NPDC053079 TaxID=3365697 RepID=UPI0037D7AD98
MGSIERPRRVVRPAFGAAGPKSPATARTTAPAAAPRPARERYGPRGQGLRDAVRRLDARLDAAAFRELTGRIRDEYADAFGDVPIGFVAQCHLGPPYVDHRLSLLHEIIDHFAPGQPMPDPFSGARMLVRTGHYAYVEVYASGTLLPVLEDGTVVRP